jgi:hypothetical protein
MPIDESEGGPQGSALGSPLAIAATAVLSAQPTNPRGLTYRLGPVWLMKRWSVAGGSSIG